MSQEKIRLNMGVTEDEEYDACENVIDRELYMPDDHRHLFGFMKADIVSINHLVRHAVSEMDITSLERAEEQLSEIHPYFAGKTNHDRRMYYLFNSAALFAWFNPGSAVENLKAIGIKGEEYLDGEYWTKPGRDAHTIDALIECQSRTKRKVVLLLDDSNPEYAEAPMSIRSVLYGLIDGDMHDEPEIANATARYILPSSSSLKTLSAVLTFDEQAAISFYKSIDDFVNTGVLPESLKTVIDSADQKTEEGYTEYETEYLEDVLNLEIFLMLRDGTRVKKCETCGRYFPVTAENNRFCDIPDTDGTSCLSRAVKKEFEEDVKQIYTRAYRTHFARIKSGKETKESLDEWRKNAIAMQERVYRYTMTLEEYRNALKQ